MRYQFNSAVAGLGRHVQNEIDKAHAKGHKPNLNAILGKPIQQMSARLVLSDAQVMDY